LENLEERDHLHAVGVDGTIELKWNVKGENGTVWIGFVWLRIGRCGGLLWAKPWIFGFHNMRGISWLAEDQLASQGLSFMELVYLAYIYFNEMLALPFF